MKVTILSYIAILLVGCVSMRMPKVVDLENNQGTCTGSIEPEYAPGKICTDTSDTWKRVNVKISSPPLSSSHATLWVAPGSKCSTNSIPLDIREVESCQRFGYRLE